jgi:ATP-dependent Clp protease ATP-binding subunit ClpC
MFERLNGDTRQAVVVVVHNNTRSLCHYYIGREHILLSLFNADNGATGQVLMSLGITIDGARQRTESMVGRSRHIQSRFVRFTASVKVALELSLGE